MNTIEKINEQIEVLVAYTKKKVVPLAFSWKNKKYSVKNINFVHAKYEGRNKFYFFSISTGADYFKLIFNTDKNEWFLNEAFYG
ncbi:MAG: hypothetical protein WCT18_01695 [Patescibacteria group bacterium]